MNAVARERPSGTRMPLSTLSKALLQRFGLLRLPPVHPLVLTLAVSALLVLFYNAQLW